MVNIGGSVTNGTAASVKELTSWRALLRNYLISAAAFKSYAFTNFNAGVGGTTSWYGLVRLQTDALAYSPALIVVEFAVNDSADDTLGDRVNGFAPAGETLLRRVRTAYPNAMIVVLVMTWPDGYSYIDQARRDARDKWIALATQYNCLLVRWDTWLEGVMGAGYDDADVEAYLSAVGNVHPNDAGHAAAYDAIADVLSAINTNQQSSLPARYYAEAEDYEQTPIVRNGNDSDSETGTWAGTAPARTSSTSNSTISWTGTFCSFGWDSNYGAGAGTVAWSLDGGAYTNVDLSAQGVANRDVWNFTRGAHTVTLKVVSGTVTINRFLAI